MTGKSPPNIDGMTSLKVGNISYRTRTLDLHHIFGKFGDVGDVYIPRDKHSKHSRGFAFVRYNLSYTYTLILNLNSYFKQPGKK